MTSVNMIFIINQGRCGSTKIATTLGCHPDILNLGEPGFLLGDTTSCPSLYRKEAIDVYGGMARLSTIGVGAIKDFSPKVIDKAGKVAINGLVDVLLENTNTKMAVDKTPAYFYNFESLRLIRQNFPNSIKLVLVKHPRWTYLSHFHSSWGQTIRHSPLQWAQNHISSAKHILKRFPNIPIFHIEDVQCDPKKFTDRLETAVNLDSGTLNIIADENIPRHGFIKHDYPNDLVKKVNSIEEFDVAGKILGYEGEFKINT